MNQYFKLANSSDFRNNVSFLGLYRGKLVAIISNKWPHQHNQKWAACISRPVQNWADLYPFGSENEISLPQGTAACLLTSSFIAAFLAGWFPAAAKLEEKDTDAFYQLLAGNFPTPQKTKAFHEFLSHSNSKRTEVLFSIVIDCLGFER